ncbi:hypothetical protein STAQ_29900 [Allostella sp. ATCC 35155]|nr:hypothetical protein STAQ_29900 [Stella sp. ATCC 35155]
MAGEAQHHACEIVLRFGGQGAHTLDCLLEKGRHGIHSRTSPRRSQRHRAAPMVVTRATRVTDRTGAAGFGTGQTHRGLLSRNGTAPPLAVK